MKNIYIIITLSYLSAQMPYDCLFNKVSSLNRSELQSNAIIDIRNGLENELYIGTGDSLGYADITDPLSPIFSIVRDELLPEGGIPALKTYKLNNNKIMIVLSVFKRPFFGQIFPEFKAIGKHLILRSS